MKNKLWIIGFIIAFVLVIASGRSEGGTNSSDSIVTTIAGEKINSGSKDGIGSAARFSFTASVTTDGTNLYVADTFNNTIRSVIISTGEVMTLAGTQGIAGSTDGLGAAALFDYPQGITADGTNVFVVDTANCTVRKVVISTGVVSTFAGMAGVCDSTDGTGTAARFNAPHGITTDGANLYVTDTYNATIRKIVIPSGEVTTFVGTPGVNGSTDGTGTAARFNFVSGIATDGSNLYVADSVDNTIRKIVIATGDVTTLAGKAGVSGSTDGIGTVARFSYPQGIATDGTNLYVTDNANLTIRKIVISTGEVSTLAGQAGVPGTGNGIGTTAQFFSLHGITTDGSKLFVTDMGAIRTIQ